MKLNWRIFTALILTLSCYACTEKNDTNPTLRLDEVGFVGSLPYGTQFGTGDIRTTNGFGISGDNFKYSGYHSLAIRNFDTGWTITLDTPSRDLPDDTPGGETVDIAVYEDLFDTYFPYAEVLKAFQAEKSKADQDPNYSSNEKLRVQVSNIKTYKLYAQGIINSGSVEKIRVLEVIEGSMQNLAGGNVRTIEVIIEFDLPLSEISATMDAQQGTLKGIARFRYREDYDQSEFVQG